MVDQPAPDFEEARRIAERLLREADQGQVVPFKLIEKAKLARAVYALFSEREAREEIEADLRREWWINHGHDYAMLYGDDGEMQCQACPADFKRQPISELRKVVFDARLVRASKATALPATESAQAEGGLSSEERFGTDEMGTVRGPLPTEEETRP